MHTHEIAGSRTSLPVSLDEVREYLGIYDQYSSPLLQLLLEAAVSAVERHSGRATTKHQRLVWATPDQRLAVPVPYPPLQEIEEVVVVTPGGADQVLDADQYTLDQTRLVPVLFLRSPAERVRLKATVGYDSAADVPADLRLACLRTVLLMWEARSQNVTPPVDSLEDGALWQAWATD